MSGQAIKTDDQDGKVAVGVSGRLFIDNDTNRVMQQQQGKYLLSAADVALWDEILHRRSRECSAREAEYALLVAPESHSIYPEELPVLKTRTGQKPIRQILSRFTGGNLVYPQDAMRAARVQGEVCHAADSHWTSFGAYIAYLELLKHLRVELSCLDRDDVIVTEREDGGDLGQKFDPPRTALITECRPSRMSSKKIWNNGVKNRGHMSFWFNPSHNAKPKGLLLTDSYGWKIQRFLAQSFSEMFVVHSPMLEYDVLDRYKPEVVISVMAERFLVRVPNDGSSKTALVLAQEKAQVLEYPDWSMLKSQS